MPDDPFVREKFTKERSAARKAIREYFKRYPNDRFQTELESWRHLQSQNFEFTMKRLREPIAKEKPAGRTEPAGLLIWHILTLRPGR